VKKNILIIIFIIIAAVIIFSFNGNGATKDDSNKNDSDKLVALSTFTIISDMVREVGGDKVEAISLTKPGAEIHGYQPTPNDLVQASRAQVIFENGMNLELWTEKLKASIPNVPIVTVSTGVEIRYITEDAYEGKPNHTLGCHQNKAWFMLKIFDEN